MKIEHFPYRETPAPRAICKSRAYRSQVPNPLYEVGNFKSVGESAKAHRCNQIEEEKMSGLVSVGAALLTTPFHLFTPISIQTRVNTADNLRTNIRFSSNLRQMQMFIPLYSHSLEAPAPSSATP